MDDFSLIMVCKEDERLVLSQSLIWVSIDFHDTHSLHYSLSNRCDGNQALFLAFYLECCE